MYLHEGGAADGAHKSYSFQGQVSTSHSRRGARLQGCGLKEANVLVLQEYRDGLDGDKWDQGSRSLT